MKISNIVLILLGVMATVLIVYGSYWVAKTISYNMFYEDMVRSTIQDVVKPECMRIKYN